MEGGGKEGGNGVSEPLAEPEVQIYKRKGGGEVVDCTYPKETSTSLAEDARASLRKMPSKIKPVFCHRNRGCGSLHLDTALAFGIQKQVGI